ncbi:MAG: hypothetical protein AMXMBFR83_13200 [Phycisphaerae bacterium]
MREMKPTHHDPPPPGSRAALVAAAALTLLGGIGYRQLAAQYGNFASGAPVPRGTLARVPHKIGDWVGRDVPLDERIVKATDTDDHLHRQYRDTSGDTALIWVACGVRLRDLMPHRPEVCYTGAGWVLRDERRIDLRISEGASLPCRLLSFRKSGISEADLLVLNYYLVRGDYSPDVSSLRSQAARLDPRTDYMAQVQIVQNGVGAAEPSQEPVCRLATTLGPVVRQVLEATVRKDQP